MQAAIYCRASTEEQTVAHQLSACPDEITRRGWTVAAEFSDEGISGSTTSRPALDAMLVGVRAGRYDAVVAAAGDRLGRSTIHVLQLESELRASGVALVLLRGGTDTSTPAGIAMFQMLAVFAELECATIRARIKSALAHKRAQGVKLGAPKRLDDAEIRRLKAATPDLSIREIAARCRCSNSAVARVLSM